MIDEEKTYAEKWYYSTDLSHGSHKPVWAICEGENCEREGGRGRWVEFRQYRKLCQKCVIKTRRAHKFDGCEIHTEKLHWVDDDKTFAEKGYRSTWLKPNSNREVWRVCARCGNGKWVMFRHCTELCHLCAHTVEVG